MKTQLPRGHKNLCSPTIFHPFPFATSPPAIETTSWALRSQTLFGWHLSCGCSTWLSEQNLVGKIWVKCSWTFFFRGLDFGRWLFLEYFEGDFLGERELHTKKSKGAFGCISGVVRLLESLMVRFIHRRMSISISHLPVQKLCHVLYPFLCKLQYLTNLQFPERREINHQTNFLQNKKKHHKHHPQFVPPKQIHLQIST